MNSDTSLSTAMGYKLLRETCGQKCLPSSAVILLSGEDARGWLQGQVTQDLRNLLPDGSQNACLCKSTGQIEAILKIYRCEQGIIIVTDAPDVVLQRVNDFVILEDVAAQLLPGVITTIQGPQATKVLSSQFNLPSGDASCEDGVWLLRHDRTGLGGWDVFSSSTSVIPDSIEVIDEESWLLARLEAGFPEIGVDIDSKTLPPELGPAFEGAHVSYKKGCYSGQEVLHRIYARGHTNRTWVGLFCDGQVEIGAEVSFRNEVVGTVTRVADSPEFGRIAAAIVKNRVAQEGLSVSVAGVAAEVIHMPFLHVD
ncbi:glycine cleavage T C-terminal barrel domain-containing protein [Kamptonema cortianum]|nr:glycine cleavage T C-terminal barrel domain-containing protein [Geitlerinema splendidum]MDK3156259.1 glycine cleavage T C-terminal barrel domain-containing protein [Kamptonema cortianum]